MAGPVHPGYTGGFVPLRGPHGIEHLVPISDSVVIVDVLTSSTAVVVAAARRPTVFDTDEVASRLRYGDYSVDCSPSVAEASAPVP